MIYLGGSMRNEKIQQLAIRLRALGHDVFDDWMSPGPDADDHWQAYERQRGRTFKEALRGVHARSVFSVDIDHLDAAATFVLVLPAGKSAHMELGYCRGSGVPTVVFMDGEPERFDIMYLFATHVVTSEEELIEVLKNELPQDC